jgi:hypothetical protein
MYNGMYNVSGSSYIQCGGKPNNDPDGSKEEKDSRTFTSSEEMVSSLLQRKIGLQVILVLLVVRRLGIVEWSITHMLWMAVISTQIVKELLAE